ncbi:glycoside hydrolase family 13 protein, partial [[Clostridium] dakarense]|uniref:glycoside hydrolase family 13 protein n=1 Tax=Faecalimicrobium dakarense TaxID=1301100 RepID=UPI0004B6B7DC
MGNIINYNSWENKAPFGALKINQGMKISINVNEDSNISNIAWVILREDVELSRINLVKESENCYKGECSLFEEVGIYFYYFEVELNNNQKVFYGRSREDGQACEYSYYDINKYQVTVYEEYEVPTWYKEGIVYQIFVDRFNNGNKTKKPSNPKENSFIYGTWSDIPMYIKNKEDEVIRWDFHGGNLKGIIDKLTYLKRLGVSIIYLSPIFESSSNHKYDTGNYENIDPMFGDEEIFEDLIKKAEKKGINIVLDGVFSHTGADSKYFNKYGTYDEVGAFQSQESKYSSWYNFKNFPLEYKCWWGVKELPNVNELDPGYIDYIIKSKDSIIRKWTSKGVKGWRLDVADELPTKFIKLLKEELKDIDNEAVLSGEVWEDASNKVSYDERRSYLLGNQLDSVMGYPFRSNVVSFLKGEITSKDLRNKFMEIKENYPKEAFKSNLNLIGSHDVNRIKTELNEDKEMVKLAVSIQMTFEGVPYIYYGDEAGLIGEKDPDNRRTYPWNNEDEDMIEFYKNTISTRKN